MAEVVSDRSMVFFNATRLALRDGQLTNGEKRILRKLAHALRLGQDEPKRVYESVLSGDFKSIEGEILDVSEMRLAGGLGPRSNANSYR